MSEPLTTRSRSLSLTFTGRSSRMGFPHSPHFGRSLVRAASMRFSLLQKGQATVIRWRDVVSGDVDIGAPPRSTDQRLWPARPGTIQAGPEPPRRLKRTTPLRIILCLIRGILPPLEA